MSIRGDICSIFVTILMIPYSFSLPAFAVQASQTFYAQIQHEPYKQAFHKLPMRSNAIKALNELYSSTTSSSKLRWDKQNLFKASSDLERALGHHGLEVLNPLTGLFSRHDPQSRDIIPVSKEGILFSAALINILDRFLYGHLSHETPGRNANTRKQINTLKEAAIEFFDRSSVDSFLARLQPGWPLYPLAIQALGEARKWSAIIGTAKNPGRRGDCSEEINAFAMIFDHFEFGNYREMTDVVTHVVRRRLILFSHSAARGYEKAETVLVRTSVPCFNDAISQTVSDFQYRTSLPITGNIDVRTASRVRRLLRDWIDTLRINLDRMRWVALSKHGPMVIVNVPDFHLNAFRDGELVLSKKVVVGERMHHTPLFEDTMKYVVFRPSWWVPESIVQDELIDLVRNDPLYLEKYGFVAALHGRAITGPALSLHARKLRDPIRGVSMSQRPGNHNVLGNVKFVFPNSKSIYLHDTPDEYLFNREDRSFSHGCIRVENPEELARFVLRDNRKVTEVESMMHSMDYEENKRVNISRPVPIAIVYWTLRKNVKGAISYAADLYQYDKEAIKSFYGSSKTH